MDIISVTPIIYHNVMVCLFARNDDERFKIQLGELKAKKKREKKEI